MAAIVLDRCEDIEAWMNWRRLRRENGKESFRGYSSRKNFHSSHLTISFALRPDSLEIDQGRMNNPAVLRVHRIEHERSFGHFHFLRRFKSHDLEFLLAGVAVSVGVEIDLRSGRDRVGESPAGDVLQRVEQFRIVS